MDNPAFKYDALADNFAEKSYANLIFYMRQRFIVTSTWGSVLKPGDSVFELGCGDGYLAQLLVQHGLQYTGVDISPRMIANAEQRLLRAGLKNNFTFKVADSNKIDLSKPVDAVISYRSFFTYVSDTKNVLKRWRPYIKKKIIVDLNPRGNISLYEGLRVLQNAGFSRVSWRPFFVPLNKELPDWLLNGVVLCEKVPLLRTMLLRQKFCCLLKGEP